MRLQLPVSKKDPRATGCTRSWQRLRKEGGLVRSDCPFHAVVHQLGRLGETFGSPLPAEWPLSPTAKGAGRGKGGNHAGPGGHSVRLRRPLKARSPCCRRSRTCGPRSRPGHWRQGGEPAGGALPARRARGPGRRGPSRSPLRAASADSSFTRPQRAACPRGRSAQGVPHLRGASSPRAMRHWGAGRKGCPAKGGGFGAKSA